MWIHTAGDCALVRNHVLRKSHRLCVFIQASEAATVQGGGLPPVAGGVVEENPARGACGALPGAVPYPASFAVANQRPKGEQRRCRSWVGRDARGRVARAALSPALCLILLHLRLRISGQRVSSGAASRGWGGMGEGARTVERRVARVAVSPAPCLMLLHLRLRISGQRARGACGTLPGAVPYAASSAVANQRPKGEQRRCRRVARAAVSPALCLMLRHLRLRISGQRARGACGALPGAVPYAASSAVANQQPKSEQRRCEWWVGRDGGGRVARAALSPAPCLMLLHRRLRISGQRVSSGAASGGWGGMAEGAKRARKDYRTQGPRVRGGCSAPRRIRRVARAALSPALCLMLLHLRLRISGQRARGACGALPGAVPYAASSAVANQRPKGEQRRCEWWVGRNARGRVARAALSPAPCLMLLHLRLRISGQRARGACGALPGAVPYAASSAVANQRPKGEQRRCEWWVGRDGGGRVARAAVSPALCPMLPHLRLRISGQVVNRESWVGQALWKAAVGRAYDQATSDGWPYVGSYVARRLYPYPSAYGRTWYGAQVLSAKWVNEEGGEVEEYEGPWVTGYVPIVTSPPDRGINFYVSERQFIPPGAIDHGFPEVHRVTVPAEGQPRLLYKVRYPWDGDEEELWQHEGDAMEEEYTWKDVQRIFFPRSEEAFCIVCLEEVDPEDVVDCGGLGCECKEKYMHIWCFSLVVETLASSRRVARAVLSPAPCYRLLHLRLRISGQRHTWVNTENGGSLPVRIGSSVTLHESRFVPAPWIIEAKIVGFNPDHVWTAAPTEHDVPEGTYDGEFGERPPNGCVVVRLYHPRREHWLEWQEYAQIVESEAECPTHTDPSDDDEEYVSETSEEDTN
ncbi:hypothetical protein CYMTET_4169 [Cymbomonas tetramitiformis]|uniref:Uncharacterized protein n=1 Tax=Cymbomonas tetramitiformis TaxID=36881 RepID=A0AAE0H267_9CHLO|nr:hypothetical protein CYMTET_4169 [Cymbomonas tetramitiformis]